jgi:ABC-type lipoprotein release transport system permease subunit
VWGLGKNRCGTAPQPRANYAEAIPGVSIVPGSLTGINYSNMPEKTLDYHRLETKTDDAAGRRLKGWLRARRVGILLDLIFSIVIATFFTVGGKGFWARAGTFAAFFLLFIVAFLFFEVVTWASGRLIENNFKTLLIGRYLRRRRIAWVSLIAVTLCTTMVLVVISVMGGWLNMFEASARGLSADLVVRSGSLAGFGGYEQMIDGMEKLPEVAAAVPTLQTFGLLNIGGMKSTPVQVLGLPIDRIGRVNQFPESLYRQHIGLIERLDQIKADRQKLDDNAKLSAAQKAQERASLDKEDAALKQELAKPPSFNLHDPVEVPVLLPDEVKMLDADKGILDTGDAALNNKLRFERWGPDNSRSGTLISQGAISEAEADKLRSLSDDKTWGKAVTQLFRESHWPGMIASTGVVEIRTGPDGKLQGREPFKHHLQATLMVLGVSREGRIDPNSRADTAYWIMDDSHTGMWQYDMESVYVPFDQLQTDLGMGATQATSRATGQTYTEPARTSEIHVKLKPGADPDAVKIKAQAIVDSVLGQQRRERMARGEEFDPAVDSNLVRVETWRESGAKYIDAIEHEKVLVVVLFSIISVVAIFLIFCIFYMIVAEKTKDIGIIKSVGASDMAVASIFLGYGLAIGVVGGGLALLASYVIIHNINELHALMAKLMHVRIWSPEVYAFDKIPNTMDPKETAVIVGIAVLSSVLGALIPAIRAARMNPVEALRWE